MIETSDLVSAGEVVEIAGQAWTLAHITPGMRGAYSAWLKARARQGLRDERQQGTLNADDYREEADALKRQFDAGAYNWGSPFHPEAMGEAVSVSLSGLDGKVKLLQLLLEPAHGIVPATTIVELVEASAIDAPQGEEAPLSLVVKICLDPNRSGPAREKLALILETMRTTKTSQGTEPARATSAA